MGVNISGNILMGTLGGPPRVTKYNGIGPISVVSGTARWYPEINGKITGGYFSLGTAGNSVTTVSIKKNGVEIFLLSAAAGENISNTAAVDIAVLTTDYITIDITAAGPGAADLVVSIKYQ